MEPGMCLRQHRLSGGSMRNNHKIKYRVGSPGKVKDQEGALQVSVSPCPSLCH